jgi:hypothetical protein
MASKTNKTNKTNKNKNKNNPRKDSKTRKNNKGKGSDTLLPNNTPNNVSKISQQIKNEIQETKSYSPSINDKIVSLISIKRENIYDCNTENAFLLKEPIKIGVPYNNNNNNNCLYYYEPQAKQFLLKNLAANKHINPDKIITPVQSESNCWFNTMFVSLFISDKGRKFFHFFRQLMIEGSQSNGTPVPDKVKNGLALLNYAIELSLTGNEYAYRIDTNAIIKELYETIPSDYKRKLPYLAYTREAGNPIRYFGSLIYYLNNKSLNLLFISDANEEWKQLISEKMEKKTKQVTKQGSTQVSTQVSTHVIILEFFDSESNKVTNKPTHFTINNNKYALDSCIIRNTKRHHFSSLLTCEKTEMAYDGMSFSRLVKMDWKKKINTDFTWRFEGSNDSKQKPLEWNFLNGYQMLVYYRVK